ncbi:DUF1295 domain-containing protein [Patescibacteria group bacterium]|nr:DUF1295 domain-containing protein [Patescibacteria group bacterium]
MKIKWNLVWSFYLTIVIPTLYLLNLLILFTYRNTLNLPTIVILVGIILSCIGITLWILSYLHLGASFAVLPKKTKRTKKGLYKYLKHPMYLGIWLTFLGLTFSFRSLQGVVFLNFLLLPVLMVRTKIEEKYLYD